MRRDEAELSPYLRLVQDVCRVSEAIGTRCYAWGGIVVDVLHGTLLREHSDLDCFALDLPQHQTGMANEFQSLGYQTSWMDEFQILRIDRDGVHAAFNPLTIDADLAVWHHIGRHGRVLFPVDWLDHEPRSLDGIPVYTCGPKFDLAVKLHPELLNPEWEARPKDRIAIRRLQSILESEGCSNLDFLSNIVSDSPFWVERGYPEYAEPVRIRQ